MKTRLIIVVVFSIVRGCYSMPACSSSLTSVVDACRETQSGQVNGTLYLDTGTGPNQQENRCRCSLSPSHTNTKLVFQFLEGGNRFNHTLEVAGHVLNNTATSIEVSVSGRTDLWITTDGVGGICVSVAINSRGNDKKLSITCFQQSQNNTTTTSSSSLTSAALQRTTTETTGTNPTSSYMSQTNEPEEDKENLIGPVVGGASGFVVFVSITAIVIYCIRRKHSKLNENGNHLDKTSNAQTNSKYTDMTEKSVPDKAVADNRAISITDISYDDVILERYSGCHKDKKKQPENDCRFSVYHTNEKPVQKTEGKLAVYSVGNKHPKLLTNTTQDTNENVYDRTNNSGEKEKGMEEYNRLGDNVYDRTDNSVEKLKGMEEYNRLGAFQVRGIDTDETYDSAATNTGYNVDRNVQNDYATSYRKP